MLKRSTLATYLFRSARTIFVEWPPFKCFKSVFIKKHLNVVVGDHVHSVLLYNNFYNLSSQQTSTFLPLAAVLRIVFKFLWSLPLAVLIGGASSSFVEKKKNIAVYTYATRRQKDKKLLRQYNYNLIQFFCNVSNVM